MSLLQQLITADALCFLAGVVAILQRTQLKWPVMQADRIFRAGGVPLCRAQNFCL